jgi:hypothetical protein
MSFLGFNAHLRLAPLVNVVRPPWVRRRMQGGAQGARAALDAYCHVGIARRQPSLSFRIIVERVSFDQRRITQ